MLLPTLHTHISIRVRIQGNPDASMDSASCQLVGRVCVSILLEFNQGRVRLEVLRDDPRILGGETSIGQVNLEVSAPGSSRTVQQSPPLFHSAGVTRGVHPEISKRLKRRLRAPTKSACPRGFGGSRDALMHEKNNS